MTADRTFRNPNGYGLAWMFCTLAVLSVLAGLFIPADSSPLTTFLVVGSGTVLALVLASLTPLSATILPDGSVSFRFVFHRSVVRKGTPVKVKRSRMGPYLLFRTFPLPVGYASWSFTKGKPLARHLGELLGLEGEARKALHL